MPTKQSSKRAARRATPALERAREVLRIEARAIQDLLTHLDRSFEQAVDLVAGCAGRVVVTGMGKAGIIAQKLSATLSSTGTPSLWLHPAEAIHGDLGRVTNSDVVIALSHSGETEELNRLIPVVRRLGAKVIAMTGRDHSALAQCSDVVLDYQIKMEACPLNLAPTASTTAMLALSDALAMAVVDRKGFREEDFALLHPGGQLGKRLLLTVGEVMRRGAANPIVSQGARVKEVLLAITKARAGCALVVDGRGMLAGIFTDGDLRRHLETHPRLIEEPMERVMTRGPKTITADRLAVDALQLLQQYKIDELPVVDARGRPVGLLDVQDLLKTGLV